MDLSENDRCHPCRGSYQRCQDTTRDNKELHDVTRYPNGARMRHENVGFLFLLSRNETNQRQWHRIWRLGRQRCHRIWPRRGRRWRQWWYWHYWQLSHRDPRDGVLIAQLLWTIIPIIITMTIMITITIIMNFMQDDHPQLNSDGRSDDGGRPLFSYNARNCPVDVDKIFNFLLR